MGAPTAEIYIEEAGQWAPLEVTPSTAAPIVPYQPPPNPPRAVEPLTPRTTTPTADYFDSSKPNHVNVDPRDWTPEIRDLNNQIDNELKDMARDAQSRADWDNYIGGRRGRNAAGQIMEAVPLINDAYDLSQLMDAVADATGVPVMPHQTAGAILDPNDGFLDFLNPMNWFGGNAPIEQGTFEGDPAFDGGQCNFSYNVRLNATWRSDDSRGVRTSSTGNAFLQGPITFTSGPAFRRARGATGGQVQLDISNEPNPEILSFSWDVTPKNSGDVDNCGAPQGEPVQAPVTTQPHEPTDFTGNPSAPTVPDIQPPQIPDIFPDIPGVEGDEPEGQPIDEPVVPTIPENPGVPDLPGTDPSGDGGNGGGSGGNGNGNDDENLSCCEKIDAIHGYFQVSGRESIDLADCGAEGADLRPWEGAGFSGVYRALETLSMATQELWSKVKCGPDVHLGIPEWWAVRPGSDIPQLCVTLREVKTDGSLGGSAWGFSIPHYNKPKDFRPVIPNFTKGSYFATLTLKDNTKLVINAINPQEAESVVNSLVPYINAAYLTNPLNIHLGRRRGKALVEKKVGAAYVQFYSQGQQNPQPDWDIDLRLL